jgi:FtsH-binding integral membrane protein
MSTLSGAPAVPAKRLPGRRYDRQFFSAMIVLMLAAVALGFAHTYYLAGVFNAPLPSRIIHIHGAVFSLWMLLLLAQTLLVTASRVDLHRKLGLAGFLLAGVMVVLGVLGAADALRRQMPPPDPLSFSIVPVTSMMLFGGLMALAYRARRDPARHKRLIIVAMVDVVVAAIVRWPFLDRSLPAAALISCVFLALLVAYDLWSLRRIHPATLWGTVVVVLVQQARGMIGATPAWHDVARWMQSWGI